MHFLSKNQKKWRKRTQLIFRFYMKIGPSTFLGGPLGRENDIIFKISHRKKLWRPSTAHKLTQEPFSIVRLLNTKKKSTPCLRLSVRSQARINTEWHCLALYLQFSCKETALLVPQEYLCYVNVIKGCCGISSVTLTYTNMCPIGSQLF